MRIKINSDYMHYNQEERKAEKCSERHETGIVEDIVYCEYRNIVFELRMQEI